MKKFAKIMALALALCMVMSVAALASDKTLVSDHVLNVNVTGAAGDQQVALLILKAGADMPVTDDTDIVYVGQMAATSGEAAFNGITINNLVEAVDIYAGSAKYAEDNGRYETVVEDFALVAAITDVTVDLKTAATIVPNAISNDPNANLYGTGVSAEFKITRPDEDDVEAAYIIWSLRTSPDGSVDENTRYTKAYPLNITGLSGAVRLSAVFVSGTVADDGDEPPVITGANAIFKFERAENDDDIIIIDEDDEAKMAPSEN